MGATGHAPAGPERGGSCGGGPGVGRRAAPAGETAEGRQTGQATLASAAVAPRSNGLVGRIATNPLIWRSAPGAGDQPTRPPQDLLLERPQCFRCSFSFSFLFSFPCSFRCGSHPFPGPFLGAFPGTFPGTFPGL